MVSRTRIPTGMYPTGYTPSTPSGKVTPEAMTKDGSGEPHNKEIIQDYPCGDEAGHYFISSPVNTWSIGRSGAVVLYVEGGCPNFTWASDNAWATFGTAETSVRYNTISSTADEGQDTIVTVTDANGLEVTISVPWHGGPTCCEDVPLAFSVQTAWDEVDDSRNWPGEVVILLDGGCPPFDWTVSGTNFTLDNAASNSRRNRLANAVGPATPEITVTDLCDTCLRGSIFLTAQVDSHVFDATKGAYPGIAQVSGDLFCVAYRGPDDDGWARSVNITAAGVISEPASNTLEFNSTEANYCQVCTRGSVLCIAYLASDSHRYLEAVVVAGNGTLSQHASNVVQFATNNYPFGQPVHISGDIIAIPYTNADGIVHICTVDVSSEGEVTDPVVDDHTLTPGVVSGYPSMAKVTDNMYVVVFQSTSNYGYAQSVAIADNGTISDPGEDKVDITGQYLYAPYVVKMYNNTFVVAYNGPGDNGDKDGWATVFHCSNAGTVSKPTDNNHEFEDSSADQCWALRYSNNVFGVAYSDGSTDGQFKMIKCTVSGGAATWSLVDSWEFDENHCEDVKVLQRDSNTTVLCYTGPDDDGIIKTFGAGLGWEPC